MRNLLILLIVALTSGCGRDSLTGPTRGSLSIGGRVVDYRTQAAVAGRLVEFDFEGTPLTAVAGATTDATGSYVMTLPAGGTFIAAVDGSPMGVVLVNRPAYRGDLFVSGGDCVARYGTLTDVRTARPVAGATVSLSGGTTISGGDGWYRIDLGCAGSFGFNTTFLYVTHRDYVTNQRVVGRGVQGVRRLDLELERR